IHGDESRAKQPEDDRQKLSYIRQLHDHPVAWLQPQLDEARGRRVSLPQQFCRGPAPVTVHQSNVFGPLLRTAAQQRSEGVARPVPRTAIFVRKVLRPDLLGYSHGCVSSRGTPCSSMPSAPRSARNLAEVSCVSASGSEPDTMPAPAYSAILRSQISRQSIDTYYYPY